MQNSTMRQHLVCKSVSPFKWASKLQVDTQTNQLNLRREETRGGNEKGDPTGCTEGALLFHCSVRSNWSVLWAVYSDTQTWQVYPWTVREVVKPVVFNPRDSHTHQTAIVKLKPLYAWQSGTAWLHPRAGTDLIHLTAHTVLSPTLLHLTAHTEINAIMESQIGLLQQVLLVKHSPHASCTPWSWYVSL